eukprot:Tbor_TRINITY_DN652_c0_g1::TRINITY_DN652_c0_g1_i1::g.1589::m.1589/K18587/COQ9; ubiquinone biosynthesis protein COQ9
MKILHAALAQVPALGFKAAARSYPAPADIFPRGLEAALVEFIRQKSNNSTRDMLQTTYSYDTLMSSDTACAHPSQLIEEAVTRKLVVIQPYIAHWPEAIAIEMMPSNAPYAVKDLAEFVDDVAFYAERAASILALRRIKQFAGAPSKEIHKGAIIGRPLSSGPHDGTPWFVERGKISGIYLSGITSMIGEYPCVEYPRSYALVKELSHRH